MDKTFSGQNLCSCAFGANIRSYTKQRAQHGTPFVQPPPPPSAGVHVTPPPPTRRAIFRSPSRKEKLSKIRPSFHSDQAHKHSRHPPTPHSHLRPQRGCTRRRECPELRKKIFRWANFGTKLKNENLPTKLCPYEIPPPPPEQNRVRRGCPKFAHRKETQWCADRTVQLCAICGRIRRTPGASRALMHIMLGRKAHGGVSSSPRALRMLCSYPL